MLSSKYLQDWNSNSVRFRILLKAVLNVVNSSFFFPLPEIL